MPQADVFVVPRPGRTGTPAELENAEVKSVVWELGVPETAEFWMPIRDPKITKPKLLENEVQIWINGALEFWGYPHRSVNNPKGSLFSCESILGYLAGRNVLTPLTYTNLEQRTIAWNLIAYAQSGTDQALGITSATFAGTTKLRDRTYGDTKQNVLEALQAFAGLSDGFEFEIKAYGDGRREFTPYYPSKGVTRPALALEWGRNLTDYTHTEEALPGTFANRSIVVGPVANNVRLEADNRDATSATKYGEFQIVLSDGAQDSTQDWLDGRAAEETAQRKDGFSEVDLEVVEVPVALLGIVRTGDTLPVLIKNGRVDVAANYRVRAIKWVPPQNKLWLGIRAQ